MKDESHNPQRPEPDWNAAAALLDEVAAQITRDRFRWGLCRDCGQRHWVPGATARRRKTGIDSLDGPNCDHHAR